MFHINKLPIKKVLNYLIELKMKSYETLETTEDEPPYIGDMQLVDE